MVAKNRQLKSASFKIDERKKILTVDDHPIMRQGLIQLIENEPDLMICSEAQSAEEVVSKVIEFEPDLVLADITLPGRNGIELIKDLQAMKPDLPVLVLSMHDESMYAERVLRAGGRGYIMKQEGGKKLIEAIRQVLDGQISVSKKMAAKILEIFSGSETKGVQSPVDRLTNREIEVFQFLGQGLSTRQIAQQLHLSVKTVEVHRAHIKEKLGIESAPKLMRYAVCWLESQNAAGSRWRITH
ncbi:MAG TPA: response regulator transcription factor [Verrucomicrobiales bacterium]|nr:response regulator transcription factor [Verrucomicrobiales bacterium]